MRGRVFGAAWAPSDSLKGTPPGCADNAPRESAAARSKPSLISESLQAARGDVVLDADDLGVCSLLAAHAAPPIQSRLSRQGSCGLLRPTTRKQAETRNEPGMERSMS